jgi:hypothetical protein
LLLLLLLLFLRLPSCEHLVLRRVATTTRRASAHCAAARPRGVVKLHVVRTPRAG